MSDDIVRQLAFELFQMSVSTEEPEPIVKQQKQEIKADLSYQERLYVETTIDAIVGVFTDPIKVGGPRTIGLGLKNQSNIIIERMATLLERTRDHSELIANADDENKAYSKARKEIQAIRERMTNWEVCLAFCEASLRAPLDRDAIEEYKRAFAHCYGVDTYYSIFAYEPIRVNGCKMTRYAIGFKKLPPLDDKEIAWIKQFNRELKEFEQANDVFDEANRHL